MSKAKRLNEGGMSLEEKYPEATIDCKTCSFISFNFQTIVYL